MKVQNKYGIQEHTLITVESSECWCCGSIGKTTHHHAIPQRLKPKQNAVLPLCYSCHDKINKVDVHGLVSYIKKLSCRVREVGFDLIKAVKFHKR